MMMWEWLPARMMNYDHESCPTMCGNMMMIMPVMIMMVMTMMVTMIMSMMTKATSKDELEWPRPLRHSL